MNLDIYEKWLIEKDKKRGSAYSYKIAIPHIEKHYSEIKGLEVALMK